jgi:hypothetical protein
VHVQVHEIEFGHVGPGDSGVPLRLGSGLTQVHHEGQLLPGYARFSDVIPRSHAG